MKKKFVTIRMICVVAWLALLGTALSAEAQTLTPTFESIGIDWKIGVDSKSRCQVEFRAAGETTWRPGLDLFTDLARDEKSNSPFRFNNPETEGFRGSIVMLQPNTRYEVKLTYTIRGGSEQTKVLSTRTWDEAFPVDGPEITVTSRKDLQEKLDALKKRKNRPKGEYVVFKGNGTTKIDGGSETQAIKIQGHSYVILRDLEIVGADESGIWISESDHIVIENCRIHDWGEPGPQCKGAGKHAAIYVWSSSHLVVQRNTIFNPRGNSCHWPQDNEHPAGPRGIALTNWANGAGGPGVTKSVFRYNKIFSTDKDRYYSDIFNAESGGADSDIDVYSNEFANAWDDGIEIEGNNRNIRVWGNVIRNTINGVASDRVGGKEDDRDGYRVYYGPVYIWRNVITNLQAGPNDRGNGLTGPGGRKWSGGGFKIDNRKGQGAIYLFNNTVSGLARSKDQDRFIRPKVGIRNDGQHNMVVKNNIFEINNDRTYDEDMMPSSVLDYNAYSSARSNHEAHLNRENWEANGQFGVNFTYQKGDKEWDYYVQGSGKGAGTRINNFVEPAAGTAVDLGAAQAGVWSMCVGPDATRNCSNGTNNPPPPVEPLPEPEIEPIQATYAPFRNQFGHSFFSAPKTYWVTAPTYTFRHPRGNGAEGSDNRVTLKAVWDQDYLSVAVEVADDDSVAVDTDKPFKNDGIELFFDVKNRNAPTWEGNPQEHKQFIIDFNEKTLVNPDGFEVRSKRADVTERNPEHRYEVRIPWISLGIEKPAVGLEIGFDVANNDRDTGKKVHFTYTGRDTNFQVPGEFARLVLVDTPPVKVSSPAGAITVDGQLDEQDWHYTQAENGIARYDFPTDSGVAYGKMLWTPEYLYVGFRVLFDELVIQDPAKPWFNDGMEVLFDTESNGATSWDVAQGHKQLIVDIDGNIHLDPGPDEPGSLAATVAQSREQVGSTYNYAIEIAIPWSSLGVENPTPGTMMRFDLVHNDRDSDQYTGMTLSGRVAPGANFKVPSEFAELVLVETFDIFQTSSTTAPKLPSVLPSVAEARQLTIYPNPSVEGITQLELSGFGEDARVQITDMRGQVVYQNVHHESRIRVAQRFPRGLYTVRVSDGQGTMTQKLLVE